MRFQKVSVDVWKVIITSGSCLFLAFIAWVFLKLVYACFWLPGYLQQQEAKIQEELERAADKKFGEKNLKLKKDE